MAIMMVFHAKNNGAVINTLDDDHFQVANKLLEWIEFTATVRDSSE